MLNLDEFDYNRTRSEIESDIKRNLSHNPQDQIAFILQNKMQETLVNLLGVRTYYEAVHAKRDAYPYYQMHFYQLGKKKLSELLITFEYLEKEGIDLDNLHFQENENERWRQRQEDYGKIGLIYLPFLSFSTPDEFLDAATAILEHIPNQEIKVDLDFRNSMIPQPETMDLKRLYYPSIDLYADVERESEEYKEMRRKHPQVGVEVNAIHWIQTFKNRHKLNNLTTNEPFEKWAKKQEAEDNFFDKDGFQKEDWDQLRQLLLEREKEIEKLKEELVKLRTILKDKLTEEGITFSDQDFNESENVFLLNLLLSSKQKPTVKKSGKNLIYAGLLSFVLAIAMSNMPHRSMEETTAPTEIIIETLESLEDYNRKKQDEKPQEIEEQNKETREFIEEKRTEDELKIGKTIQLENQKAYLSSTDSIPYNEGVSGEVTIIALFPVTREGNRFTSLASCRTQEEMDNFLEDYSDLSTISFRAAVSRENEEVESILATNRAVPAVPYTTFFIDYEPQYQKQPVVYQKGGMKHE